MKLFNLKFIKNSLILLFLLAFNSCSLLYIGDVSPSEKSPIKKFKKFKMENEFRRITEYNGSIYLVSFESGFSFGDFYIQKFNTDSNKFETIATIEESHSLEEVRDFYIYDDKIKLITKYAFYDTYKMHTLNLDGEVTETRLFYTIGEKETVKDFGYFFDNDDDIVKDEIFFSETYLQNEDIDYETSNTFYQRSENDKFLNIISFTKNEDYVPYFHYSILDLNGNVISKGEKILNYSIDLSSDENKGGPRNLDDLIYITLDNSYITNNGNLLVCTKFENDNTYKKAFLIDNLTLNKQLVYYIPDEHYGLNVSNNFIFSDNEGNNISLTLLVNDDSELENIIYQKFDNKMNEIDTKLIKNKTKEILPTSIVRNYKIDESNNIYLIIENAGVNKSANRKFYSRIEYSNFNGYLMKESFLIKINSNQEFEYVTKLNSGKDGKGYSTGLSYPYNIRYKLFKTIFNYEMNIQNDNISILTNKYGEKEGLININIDKNTGDIINENYLFDYNGNGFISIPLTIKVDGLNYSIYHEKTEWGIARYIYDF